MKLFKDHVLGRFPLALGSIVLVSLGACVGSVTPASTTNGGAGSGGSNPGTGGAGTPSPGTVTVPPTPFEPAAAASAVRKVKSLLTGQTPTDDEIASVTASGAAGLQGLINGWMTKPESQDLFRQKMFFFFRNTFQQTGFLPGEDFKLQLLQNAGFDFGTTPGDDAYPTLVQNLQDSFARTAWQLMVEGKPFTDVLTTQRFMMTTALKSLYLQIEMPRDAFNSTTALAWKVDESGTDIPLEQTLDPSSPNYMVFADVAPVTASTRTPAMPCRGMVGMINPYKGYGQLFQVLLGYIPNYSLTSGTTTCSQHASKPYMTASDLSDWQWVSVRPLAAAETRIAPYDLPKLRTTTELGLALPRVGFYTTPAFLALWNTNDSNQHRVTVNQTLLIAFGQSFSSAATIIPSSAAGLDAGHSVAGSECYTCHKNLDPMRQFWANQFDFNDRNDFPARGVMGGAANPRPKDTTAGFAFGSVNTTGSTMVDFGNFLTQVQDGATTPMSQFAVSMAQKLCFFANSVECLTSDPEFRRVVAAFQSSGFNFAALIKELMASPLVTGSAATATSDANGFNISIARRDQLCAALSVRLGKPDLCALAAAVPSTTQAATLKLAGSVPADSFSRGSEIPVTPSDPTLFYSAATEGLCENIAVQVVDATAGTVYTSTDSANAMADMVQKIMGYPPGDPHYASALQILKDDYAASLAIKGTTATNALRSTFALACEAPTTLSFGL